jgi:hypothetical protein
MKKQTAANGADPSASIWIGRPTTALTTDVFLEKQTVLTATSITDSAVAVCHPRQGAANTKINIAYIADGVAHVVTAATKTKMSNHIWVDSGFSETASAVSIAYDGTMPKNDQGKIEFVTESQPWIFWVDSGVLYARKLGTEGTITLAQANCTDVSAIRGMWSEVGGFDFGLVVFFILSGTIYYRQYVDGVWMDAETVTFGPSSVTWTSIAAFRTWDYRVGVQGKTSDNVLYELFTQFMGIGKQNVEHLEITSVNADGDIIPVDYHDTAEAENIEIAAIEAVGARIYGLSSMPVSATNIDDGLGNYGLYVELVLDYPVTGAAENYAAFVLMDENSTTFAGTAISTSVDGKTLTITFPDFNSAFGDLVLGYTPGTVQSPAVAMTAWTIEFTPTGLVPPQIDPPEVEDIWNE